MNTQKEQEQLAQIIREDREFTEWFATLPDEHKGEADYLYQEGVKLEEIKRDLVAMDDPTEHIVRLTRWEMGEIAEMLYHRSNPSPTERSAFAKLDSIIKEIDDSAGDASNHQANRSA